MNKSTRSPSYATLVVAIALLVFAVLNLVVNLFDYKEFVSPPDRTSRIIAITLAFLIVSVPLVISYSLFSRFFAGFKSSDSSK